MKAASVNLFVSNTYSLTQSVFLVRVERYSACITVILEWIAVLIAFHRASLLLPLSHVRAVLN